jgi:hypothetical protein
MKNNYVTITFVQFSNLAALPVGALREELEIEGQG